MKSTEFRIRRKVVKFRTSYYINIPLFVARAWNLSHGDKVIVMVSKNGQTLTVRREDDK